MKSIVERYQLHRWLGTDTAKRKLMMAGYRGQGAETAFLFFRLVVPDRHGDRRPVLPVRAGGRSTPPTSSGWGW